MNPMEKLDSLNIAELQAQFATVSDAVKWYALKYYGRYARCEADTDDMLQTALLYAWQHLPGFRADKGALTTYVTGAARIACVGWIRSQKRHNASPLPDAPDTELAENVDDSADVLATMQENIWSIVKTFRDNEFIVLEGRLEGLTLKQIGNRLGGLSQQRVSQILETVLQKVKARYESVIA